MGKKITMPEIHTSRPVVRMVYAYTTPGITYHDGFIKIGDTEQDVDARIRQQTHTAGVMPKKEWAGMAMYDDGSCETFRDHDFHRYMRRLGVKQPQDINAPGFSESDKNEWFQTTPKESKGMFDDFRSNRGVIEGVKTSQAVLSYQLRREQEEAVEKALTYFSDRENGEFLFNCKPRFGKVLTTYELMKRLNAGKVLIVTNRPAIANSWYDDYATYLGRQSGYFFVSQVPDLADPGKSPLCMKYDSYQKDAQSRKKRTTGNNEMNLIDFVSLQDLKGSIHFGGEFVKLEEVAKIQWDLLVIDEAHEGVDTYRTDVAFDHINRRYTLHLSGTPFKAMASLKFPADAIYNWTYADEQQARADWDPSSPTENPYEILPRINLYTYQMSDVIREKLQRGIEIQGETEEYAFDLNEFFRVENGSFVYGTSVDLFLDRLTDGTKFPFSTEELRQEIKHSFWLLDRVESARALARKLEQHPVFKDYKVILAAGDGKIDDASETGKSFDKVRDAIRKYDKTITLSVGQLTVGVTIPEWTAVLILSNIKSPALYMQAAFRAQNPCLFQEGVQYYRKENAYVFDFDPARTLEIYEQFANDLTSGTAGGRGDLEARKANIRTFLNFFPVIGEDEDGELIELDADQVLTIPRKIRSMEVVRRGFMSNFLFQNISQVFGAPKELMDIIEKLQTAQEEKPVDKPITLPEEVQKDLHLDENGEVNPSEEFVIGRTAELFGAKIVDMTTAVTEAVASQAPDESDDKREQKQKTEAMKEAVKEITQQHIMTELQESYGEQLGTRDMTQIEKAIEAKTDTVIDKTVADYQIRQNVIEQQRTEAMQARHETGRTTEEIDREFDQKKKDADTKLQQDLTSALQKILSEEAPKEAVKTAETKVKEKEKRTIEESVRAHLRGFSRTIPSFLMAYGDDTVTLATFDTKVPDQVFLDVTSITMEEFRCLRDGKWTDPETGETKEYSSGLFDEVVFDDSIKEFLSLKNKLADYFDEKAVEDIFDYIPPQKTFQIFTPKSIVKMMVDNLEKEYPGCFDDPDKTFIDLYMKSGLYPAEIVKRLYQSPKLKELYPDGNERLKHIFEKQVFGLAPTQIIYDIAISFILGCYENPEEIKHNFRMADAVPYVKEGKLPELLDMLYPDEE